MFRRYFKYSKRNPRWSIPVWTKKELIKNILLTLEKISLNLIYLPGNHDFINLCRGKGAPKFTNNSINLHLNSFVIKDDLLLVRIGGSICSIYIDNKYNHS